MEKATRRNHDGTRCGVAFPLRNGNGLRVILDAVPVNGQLIIQPSKPRDERGGGQRDDRSHASPPDDSDIPF